MSLLTEAQRQRAAARLAVLSAVDALLPVTGTPYAAMKHLVRLVDRGEVARELLGHIELANARPRSNGAIRLTLSTVRRWHDSVVSLHPADTEGRMLAVAEAVIQPVAFDKLSDDVMRVIARWRTPNGGDLAWAVRKEFPQLNDVDKSRLYYRARRAMAKLPPALLHDGRWTGASLAAKRPYTKRTTDQLSINDVWVIDGHTLKGKWAHPETGKPFVFEYTSCLDAKDRFCVGWSVALSETALGIAEALCKGIENPLGGVPAILYSDEGAGETAKHNTDPTYGVYQQFGIEHRTGKPGNPQGRGNKERSWKAEIGDVERDNPFWRGGDMDPDTLRVRSKLLGKNLTKAVKQGTIRDEQGNVLPLVSSLPPFQNLIQGLAAAVERYNNRPHRALLRHPSEPRHLSPLEYRLQLMAEAPQHVVRPPVETLHISMMPYRLVKAARGLVTVNKQSYFSQALYDLVDGQQVRAHFDVTDASTVRIARLDGTFVCTAEFQANAKSFFPVSQIEAGRLRRYEAQEERKRAQIADIAQERDGVLAHIQQQDDVKRVEQTLARLAAEDVASKAPAPDNVTTIAERPYFGTFRGRYTWLYRHPAAWRDDDAQWMAEFVASPEYQEFADLYEMEGLGWPPAGREDLFNSAAA